VMATGTNDPSQRIEIRMVVNLKMNCRRLLELGGASEVIRPTVREVLIT